MPRIFLPLAEKSNIIKIEGERAHYLSAVLRCKKGDEIVLFDGNASHKAIITGITKRHVTAEVIGILTVNTESSLNSVLIQGLLKGEKMELVIQKTTELGVREIVPVITERSQIKETRKSPRWRKIAEEASRQSGRTAIPVIHEPIPFDDLFHASSALLLPPRPKGIIFWEEGGMSLKEAVLRISPSPIRPFSESSFFIMVGPEGGFAKKEVDIAESRGLIITSLGKRILRAETAAIAATALVQFLFGDMGGAL